MKSTLQIRTSQMSVDLQMNNHNLLRWTTMAIDSNECLANSLIENSINLPVLLTDSFYLVTHPTVINDIPLNTHIVLWDGINSYVELLELESKIDQRRDLRFFVVGWLKDNMLEQKINILPLYPSSQPIHASAWGKLLQTKFKFHVPYTYRIFLTFLSFSRYYKNWILDAKRHSELNRGGKIVFCGMVTPTEHQINGFFRGVSSTDLYKESLKLTKLVYSGNTKEIDDVLCKVIEALKKGNLENVTDLACAYSILNLLHRIKTLSLLNGISDALFINETKSNRWIDPYDSLFYSNNLYLDFGSTRGPDPIYPRTLDMIMKNKRFVSLRYLPASYSIKQYVEWLSVDRFLQHCECDAQSAYQTHQQIK